MTTDAAKIDPDTLLREQLAEHNPMWAALADCLDEWLHRMHGITAGRHNVGLFLHLLEHHGERGWELVQKDRMFTELALLEAVDASQVWHEYDHDHVILENDEDQHEIDEQFRTIWHVAENPGTGRYRLTGEGKARLAELRAEVSTSEKPV